MLSSDMSDVVDVNRASGAEHAANITACSAARCGLHAAADVPLPTKFFRHCGPTPGPSDELFPASTNNIFMASCVDDHGWCRFV